MRKIFGILLTAISLIAVGCSKEQPIAVSKESLLEREETNLPTVISREELESKVENKDDFLLLVSDAICQGCTSFKNGTLAEFLGKAKIKVYEIGAQNFENDNAIMPWKVTPTMGLIVDGAVVDKIQPISDNEKTYFNNYSSLLNWVQKERENIEQYVSVGIAIKENKLDYFVEQGKKMIVYYKRDTCGDCRYFYDSFLKDKAKLPLVATGEKSSIWQSTEFYIFDINDHYLARDPELGANDPEWLAFTAKYGLSNIENGGSAKGWMTGVIPTFQVRANGNITDSSIIFNDKMSFSSDYSSLTVEESFYNDNPYIGTTFEKTESQSAYQKYQEQTLSFYSNKLEEMFIRYR